jgi:predicted nucleic acid-binding protein
MRVLLDTNIILDALLNRQPFVTEAQQILQANGAARVSAYITATTITDIFYLARKALGTQTTIEAIKLCLSTFQICTVDKQTLETATKLEGSDFEDNLQIACALASGLDAIVTRNKADFKTAAIAVIEPAELLSQLPPSSVGTTGSPASQS